MRPDSVFVGLQNGMTIDVCAESLGPERTIGCVLGIAANMRQPGVITRQVAPADTWFSVGTLDGQRTERLDQVAAVLAHAAVTEVTDDIRSAKWMKLIANIPEMAAVGAARGSLARGRPHAGHPPGHGCECRARRTPSRSTSASLCCRASASPPRTYRILTQYSLDLLDRVLSHFSKPDTRVAVLQDWEKGRRAELDAVQRLVVAQSAPARPSDPRQRASCDLRRWQRGPSWPPSPENRRICSSGRSKGSVTLVSQLQCRKSTVCARARVDFSDRRPIQFGELGVGDCCTEQVVAVSSHRAGSTQILCCAFTRHRSLRPRLIEKSDRLVVPVCNHRAVAPMSYPLTLCE